VCVFFLLLFTWEKVDEITFERPVRITHVRVVPLYVSDSKLNDFAGFTSPGSFGLRIFGSQRDETQKCRFSELCPALEYEAPLSDSFCVHTEPLAVDHLVIRGRYRTLSIIVVGVALQDSQVENCSFLWGKPLQHREPSQGEDAVVGNGGEAENVSRRAGSSLPSSRTMWWEPSEDCVSSRILCDLDLSSADPGQFETVRKDVLGLVSTNSSPSTTEERSGAAKVNPKAVDKAIDKVVDCLERGETASFSQANLGALASVAVCASPKLIGKFAKRGGIEGLWNTLKNEESSLESKFWSSASFLVASYHQKGLESLAGHAHTTKEAGRFENLEQGLLSLAMQPEYAPLAQLVAKVITHLQLYNGTNALRRVATKLADDWTGGKGFDWEKIDNIVKEVKSVQDVFHRLVVGRNTRMMGNSCNQIKIAGFLSQESLDVPASDAVLIQSLLESKGLASMSTILTIVGTSASADKLKTSKADFIVTTIIEMCRILEGSQYFDVLLAKGTRECNALCEGLAEVAKYYGRSMSSAAKKWDLYVRCFCMLDSLSAKSCDGLGSERTFLELAQKVISCSSQLHEAGGGCDSVLRCVLDLTMSRVGAPGEKSSHVQSIASEAVYQLLLRSKDVNVDMVAKYLTPLEDFVSSGARREGFYPHPYKMDSLREINPVVQDGDEMLALRRYMGESAALTLTRVHGMVFAIKAITSLTKGVPVGTSAFAALNISDFIESLKNVLSFVHEEAMGQQTCQPEAWNGSVFDTPCLHASSVILLSALDACVKGFEACLDFLASLRADFDLGGFHKVFVRSYEVVVLNSCAPASGECQGLADEIAATYASCLRKWSLSEVKPSAAIAILGTQAAGSIGFSVAKYLHPVELLRSLELTNMLIPFEMSEYSSSLQVKLNEVSEACSEGIVSILSQGVFYSLREIKTPVLEFCMKVVHLGPKFARAVVSCLLELLQQEFEIISEDHLEIRCAENLCDAVMALSRDPLCKNVFLESGAITIMLSVFKQPLLSEPAITESALPMKAMQTIQNLCNTDICLDEKAPLYVRAVEDGPSVDEGSSFVSTMLDAMRVLPEEVTEKAIGVFALLSRHIPGQFSLRNGASQWKTNAYWSGEGAQGGGVINASSALTSAARFLRSTSNGMESEKQKGHINEAAEILEAQNSDDVCDDEGEEPPQPTALETKYKEARHGSQLSFFRTQGLHLRNIVQSLACPANPEEQEHAMASETEVQAQNRWYSDSEVRRRSLALQVEQKSRVAPDYGGDLTRSQETTQVKSGPGAALGATEGAAPTPGFDGGEIPESDQMQIDAKPVFMAEDDLYADIPATDAAAQGASPAEHENGEDLYGDIDMKHHEGGPVSSTHRAEEASASLSAENLTPEVIADLLKNPEKLQPMLERHPQLLAILQQSLNM